MAMVIFRTLFRLEEEEESIEFIKEFELCGGLDNLEQLQYSNHESIYEAANNIIEKFFGGEEIEEKEEQTNSNVN